MTHTIRTHSGGKIPFVAGRYLDDHEIDLYAPQVSIDDIARSLSKEQRWCNQLDRSVTVLQHSNHILAAYDFVCASVSSLGFACDGSMDSSRLRALFRFGIFSHDFHEFVVRDLPHGLKAAFTDSGAYAYREIIWNIDALIARRFNAAIPNNLRMLIDGRVYSFEHVLSFLDRWVSEIEFMRFAPNADMSTFDTLSIERLAPRVPVFAGVRKRALLDDAVNATLTEKRKPAVRRFMRTAKGLITELAK